MWCPSGWHFIHNFLKSTSHMKSLGTFLYHSKRRTKCQPVVTLILWLSDQSCQKNSTCSKALVGDIIIKSSRYLFTHGPLLSKMCTLIKYSHRKKKRLQIQPNVRVKHQDLYPELWIWRPGFISGLKLIKIHVCMPAMMMESSWPLQTALFKESELQWSTWQCLIWIII